MGRTGWWEPTTLNSMEDERGSQSRCRFDVMGYGEVFSDYSNLSHLEKVVLDLGVK